MKLLRNTIAAAALLASIGSSQAGWRDWFKSQDQKDAEMASALANFRRQTTIEKQLILAKAQSVEVLKYVFTDSEWHPVKSGSGKGSLLVVRYMIRWEGPVTKGGMTEFISAYDLTRKWPDPGSETC